ncbi:MAG: hypothetical protein KH409_04225 [Clostridium sp.]|jgi:predicted GNAT family N-acyltransferase|nr:hypothetical protein [Clostridium sp.]
MFKAVWSIGRDGFDRIEALRRAAGACPQCISDGKDAYAGHVYVCEETGEPIAAGRMYPDGDALIIDRIAVMPQYDAMPYAELVLRMLLFKAQELPQNNIRINCEEKRFALVRRFGFAQSDAHTFTCSRNAIVWDSECRH